MRRPYGVVLNKPRFSPLNLTGLEAWYRKGFGLDNTDGLVGQWNDQSGNGNHLVQATSSRKPRWLPYASEVYGYSPDSSSGIVTPSQDLDGDLDIRMDMKWDEMPPAALSIPIQKSLGATIDCDILIGNTGLFYLRWWDDGGTQRQAQSTTTIPAATSYTDGSRFWIRATLDVDNGSGGNDVKFYTSADGETWDQLGTTVTQAFTTTIRHSTPNGTIYVGTAYNGGSSAFAKTFRMQWYLNGALTLDFYPNRDFVNSTTLTSSTTGEDYSNVGGVQGFIADSYLYFNGTGNGIQVLDFDIAQPFTVFARMAVRTHTDQRVIFGFNDVDTAYAQLIAPATNARLTCGTVLNSGANWMNHWQGAENYDFHNVVFHANGANSFMEWDGNRTSGNAGTNAFQRFTVGSAQGYTLPSGIAVQEIVVLSSWSTDEYNQLIDYLSGV